MAAPLTYINFYHKKFKGHYLDQEFNLTQLTERFDYNRKNYSKINNSLIDLLLLKEGQIFTLSRFSAIDNSKDKPVEMFVTNIINISDHKIIELWSISTLQISISSPAEKIKSEDLTIESATKKKFIQSLKVATDNLDKKIVLTSREIECLYLYISGLTAKEIAKEFEISYRTVETHLLNIKNKYGISTKSQLKKLFKLVQYS
ncbi:LuxR C-terminal-related transcriptional regulator [Piscirickettsia litoralis]|uniref:HTH luxR-type domain-containing protein n=1 Tax=Piscirickettsia litoralis TaxID=1891921 RepID=A0ABX3A255_9GAMM|nr:LuxR C-terminal-related transcriptional regulator [Piscirickettsia litoralis]ODN42913.1 hypothetical protein BGC07_08220 [Piscirickettsia litoralis]